MSGSGVVSVLMCMVVKTKVRRLKFPKKFLLDFYVIFVPGTFEHTYVRSRLVGWLRTLPLSPLPSIESAGEILVLAHHRPPNE